MDDNGTRAVDYNPAARVPISNSIACGYIAADIHKSMRHYDDKNPSVDNKTGM